MQDGPLGQVLADAIPVEGRLAADVQCFDLALQQHQAGVQCERIVWPAINSARQADQPAGARVVDGQVG